MQKIKKSLVMIVAFMFFAFAMPVYAAPGDTITIYTNQSVSLVGTASNDNTPVSVANVVNSGTNVTISNIVLNGWGRYDTRCGFTGTLPGTANFSIRKNGVNGTILWQTTITNPYISSGILGTPVPSVPNVTLYPGESMHMVVSHNFTKSGYDPKVKAYDSESWKWNYWLTDALVQQGVDNALLAKNSADVAATNATDAYNAANTASSRVWYTGIYGGAQESVADTAGYIRNTQLPGIDTKINNLQTSVTNVSNQVTADTTPPSVDVQTVSGARATSGSSIQAIITASDNKSSTFTYSINGGVYSALPANGVVSLPVSSPGVNTITVRVKDEAGNIGTKTINIRKL